MFQIERESICMGKVSFSYSRLLNLLVSASLVLTSGCFHNPTATNHVGDQYELFAMVWENYEAHYPEFTLKEVNWQEVFYRYSPLAKEAETTEDLVMNVLLPMLSELKDAHIWFTGPENTFLCTYIPDFDPNFDSDVLMENYLVPAGFTGWIDNVGYCDPATLPYISINSWTLDIDMSRIEDFLGLAADEPAIILDVRFNSGGNNTFTGDIAGYFTSKTVNAWYVRARTGPGYDDVFYNLVRTYPDAGLYYEGIVFLLIGECSASATESFILHMMNLDNVVMLGDTTVGVGSCPVAVGLNDEWTVNTIAWSSRDAMLQPIEGHGIAPDIFVPAMEEDFSQGIDPVLEYAIELANSHSL